MARKTDASEEQIRRKSAWIIFAMIDGLVRFNTFSLYEAGTLYDELLGLCRRMLQTNHSEK